MVLVGDLFDEHGELKTYHELGVTWFEYMKRTGAISSNWKRLIRGNTAGKLNQSLFDRLCKMKNRNWEIYDLLIKDESAIGKYLFRWENEENVIMDREEYAKAFRYLYMITKSTTNATSNTDYSYVKS